MDSIYSLGFGRRKSWVVSGTTPCPIVPVLGKPGLATASEVIEAMYMQQHGSLASTKLWLPKSTSEEGAVPDQAVSVECPVRCDNDGMLLMPSLQRTYGMPSC